jgi:hypothetical protein
MSISDVLPRHDTQHNSEAAIMEIETNHTGPALLWHLAPPILLSTTESHERHTHKITKTQALIKIYLPGTNATKL